MGKLEGKVAVITGGAGGIGRAAGAMFAAEGADVLLVDMDAGALEEAVKEIGSNRVSWCVADVTRAADNDAMIATAEERYGGVDIVIAGAARQNLTAVALAVGTFIGGAIWCFSSSAFFSSS